MTSSLLNSLEQGLQTAPPPAPADLQEPHGRLQRNQQVETAYFHLLSLKQDTEHIFCCFLKMSHKKEQRAKIKKKKKNTKKILLSY